MELRHILLWLPMIVLAFANGTLRQFVLLKSLSESKAHQLSTLLLICLCAIYTWMAFPHLRIQNGRQALLVGFVWMLLTVGFEFTLGRLSNRPWTVLLQDYDLLAGRIWPLFLAALFAMPYIVYLSKSR